MHMMWCDRVFSLLCLMIFFMFKLGNIDRQNVVIECDYFHALSNKFTYFYDMDKALNISVACYFFNFLCRRYITSWNKRLIPETKYRNNLQILWNSLLHFLIKMVLEKKLYDNVFIVKNQVYLCWEKWCQTSKVNNIYSFVTFSRALQTKYIIFPQIIEPTFNLYYTYWYDEDDDISLTSWRK